jgi:hypothetical protein
MHAEPVKALGIPLSAGVVAIGCWGVVLAIVYAGFTTVRNWSNSKHDPKVVELDADGVSLPRYSAKAGFLRARYADILRIEERELPGQKILEVDTLDGESRLLARGFSTESQYSQFKRLLLERWKAPGAAATAPASAANPQEAALMAAIDDKTKADPLIGAKIAAKEILNRLLNGMKDEQGVHSESLLCALGALAGYACQASLRAKALISGQAPDALLVVVDTKDGQQFYFGDALNQKVAEDDLSIWSLAASAASHAGAKSLTDLKEIFERTAATVGSEQFGIPKPIEGHAAGDLPINFLRVIWPGVLPVVKKLCANPDLWPIAFGLAIQEAIMLTSKALPPEIGLTVVMEAAVPMSKVKL